MILEFEPSSLLPACDVERIKAFEASYAEFLQEELEIDERVTFPAAYRELVLASHGGVPRARCFRTQSGQIRVLGRFLNYLEPEDLEGQAISPTWRRGVDAADPAGDIRLDYNIRRYSFDDGSFWERIGVELVAFAGIDTAGQDCRDCRAFDLLCFDYSKIEAPRIVTWGIASFEEQQITEHVADSFEEFLNSLYECPRQQQPVENF